MLLEWAHEMRSSLSDAVSVGRGDAAVHSREAMDRIADAANEHGELLEVNPRCMEQHRGGGGEPAMYGTTPGRSTVTML